VAEDGRIPEHYPLQETTTADVAVRTELNVLDSDGTLILAVGTPRNGTVLTKQCAEHHRKPHLVVDLEAPLSPEEVAAWLHREKIAILNVAGPRESHRPGFVYQAACGFLRAVFRVAAGP
jgi:hypothetical protein